MTDITPEQLVEEYINDIFGNRLTAEEHSLAVQIAKEIYYETASNAEPLAQWRERVSQFEQDLHTRLSQAETPEQRAALRFAYLYLHDVASEAATNIFSNPPEGLTYLEHGLEHAEDFLAQGETAAAVRELVLKLYVNAGVTLGQAPFLDAEKKLALYQRGLEHAEDFLEQGETAASVRELVLQLYNIGFSGTYYNTGQTGQVISLLPINGLWTWVALAQLKPNDWQTQMGAWQILLGISPAPAHFTVAFQTLLRTMVLNWHCSSHPHRHFGFIPTPTLLAISEGLYAVEQATDNQKLQTVYQRLVTIADAPFMQTINAWQAEQHKIQQTLDTLDKPFWWYRWQRWWLNREIQNYQQLIQTEQDLAKESDDWQRAVQQAEFAQIDWLASAIDKHLDWSTQGLTDLSAIALAVLLASDSVQTGQTPELRLEAWQPSPPWQAAASLRAALAASDWQTWADNPNKPVLYQWTNALERNDTVQRLTIVWAVEDQPQPKLQAWLRELVTDNPPTLPTQLRLAWHSAQTQAKQLAPILTALTDATFQDNLFAARDYTDNDYQQALAAIILGDVKTQLEQNVRRWLEQQVLADAAGGDSDVLKTFNTLKYRFTRAAALYRNPRAAQLEQAVHDWAKVLLEENLQGFKNLEGLGKLENLQGFKNLEGLGKLENLQGFKNLEGLWEILERARVGLAGLSLELPTDWQHTLGTELWQALTYSIMRLGEGHKPTAQEMWPPLETWLKTIKNHPRFKRVNNISVPKKRYSNRFLTQRGNDCGCYG